MISKNTIDSKGINICLNYYRLEMNESQTSYSKDQKTESSIQRRAARQKRVTQIVRILGFPSSGIGIAKTVSLLREGDFHNAMLIGILTIAVFFMAASLEFNK